MPSSCALPAYENANQEKDWKGGYLGQYLAYESEIVCQGQWLEWLVLKWLVRL